ncbi:porin [Herminiimonas fonticola]|uniref:Putative porin n=1 Tax=Herminiimonas fonticola TaxID=303380 RepID=A0A4R6G5C6_9BURK|nr:porin [Herminiimonas fonticola]RBA22955.1 Gram-negative porin [Herminiimonas fonticola]TDN89603.1 putative porin [Herminiimonas fonticola]
MKNKYLATAMLAAFGVLASSAYAQSNVTVYGRVDTGVEYLTNASASKNNLVRLNSGTMNTSRIGFQGTEDLGNGLKAVFQLESGFKADTGEQDDTELFKRQANVGLEGSWGRLVAGRSYTTTYDFILPFDSMAYSASYSWITSAGATGGRKDGMVTNLANMLKYQGKFGDFKLGATYSFGEVAGSTSDSAKFDLGAGYNKGPLRLAATVQHVNGLASIDKTTIIHAAGGYQIGSDWDVTLGYRNYKKTFANNAADVRSDFYWTGLSYKATPALTLIGLFSYQDIKNVAANTDADPYMLSLRAKYALSKRTDLYLSAAYAKAKNQKLVGLSRDDANGFANNQAGMVAGIQHRF